MHSSNLTIGTSPYRPLPPGFSLTMGKNSSTPAMEATCDSLQKCKDKNHQAGLFEVSLDYWRKGAADSRAL